MTKCGEFNDSGYLNCSGFYALSFNKKNLRFLLTYRVGYVNAGIAGVEGDDTPSMTIGKCSPM